MAAFSLLQGSDDDDDDEDSDDHQTSDEQDNAKKDEEDEEERARGNGDETETESAPRVAAAPPPAAAAPAPALSKNARKKARRKANAAGASSSEHDSATAAAADEELELLEVSVADNASKRRRAAIASIWSVESASLDGDAELRRKFGSRAVRAAQREAAAEDSMHVRGHGRGGGSRPAPTPRRVLLVTPQSEWGRPHGLLSMALSSSPHHDGATTAHAPPASLFDFVWSDEYMRMHMSFEALAASSADPQMLMEVLRHTPCHVGALSQLHEVASHTGQAEMAAEFLQRVLWAHEASYAPGFAQLWLRGEARMRFAVPTNRYFFRALHKHAVALGRRGCPRAAISAATLLLSLDRNDPTKVRLWLDLIALKAGAPHLIWLHSLDDPDATLRLPGWRFSYALALRLLAATPPPDHTTAALAASEPPPWADGGASRELRMALLAFPGMLSAALQACAAGNTNATQLTARWQAFFNERAPGAAAAAAERLPPNGALAHLEALYWERATEAWTNPPERLRWLQEEAATLLHELESGKPAALELLAAQRERLLRWYPPGGMNPYRGLEFATLRAEQVVIPEEEPVAPEGGGEDGRAEAVALAEGEGAARAEAGRGGADGGDTGLAVEGGSAASAEDEATLAPLHEEAEALASRVEEMERLTRRGVAPHLRSMIAQRLSTLEERLTKQMIDIDGAAVSERGRDAKRTLTRRMDALCQRCAAISVSDDD